MKAILALLIALPLSACATGKAEVPDCVKRYTGDECGCNTGGLGTRAVYWKWSQAFRAAGRPMVLSLCEWGRTRPWEWARSGSRRGTRCG